jgi:SAM-dependent methyltransferase
MMSYNPKEHWTNNGKQMLSQGTNINTYPKDIYNIQEERLAEVFRSLKDVKTVLEVGCGYGRVTKLIMDVLDPKLCIASDSIPEQIQNCMDNLSYDNLIFRMLDITNEREFKRNQEFDLVVASEVLMHIRPFEIDQVIRRLVRTACKYFINIDYYELPPIPLFPHNFMHQYVEIFSKLGAKKVDVTRAGKQCIFLVNCSY